MRCLVAKKRPHSALYFFIDWFTNILLPLQTEKNHPAVQCNRSNIIFKQQLMAQSQDSFNKKEKEKKRLKKRQDKLAKREERKANAPGGGLDSMIAYVDEFGNLTDVPQDPTKKVKVSIDDIEISVRKKAEDDVPAIRNGKVDFYNDSKGFGFIRELDSQNKYFVHVSGIIDAIKEGDLVSFELQRGAKGMNAYNVRKA